ncbi:hypothetical protein [Paenibacillus rigui]|uniref:Uncharacterized protein n=1 Tax=Paenibacillus rigui TaxID=554312 RepID=A0A229UKN8_9BACL|nr:hypothetical protein [Paenibacillus rigui]OXM83953.1 hypothetical protein CF651_22840 [Paenibacillus rigui]
MNRALLLLYVILLFLYTTGFEADRFVTSTTHNRLKFALNHGGHDASLQVDKGQLSEGRIVFVRTEARSAFEASLRYNLQLHEDGTPESGSLLRAAPVVVFEDYVDDSTPGVLFPYRYTQESRRIDKLLKGPAVVYQVKVKLPRNNVLSFDGYIYKTVVYEYPLL